MKGNSKKLFALLTMIVFIISAVVSYVVFPTDTKATTQKKIVLTIEASQNQKTNAPIAFYDPNIKAFEKAYSYIQVKLLLVPDAQATRIHQTKLAAGEPSDIIVYNKVSAENELNAMKNFVDLSNEPWVKRLKNPNALKSPDGKIYGMNIAENLQAQAMVYRVDIFKKYNLKIPNTYKELLKICEVLKSKGITPIYGPFKDVWTFQIWTAGAWGTFVAKKRPNLWNEINAGKVKFSEVPEFLDILKKGYELYKREYIQKTCLSDDYNAAPAAMSSGKYAMMIMGDWFVIDMQKKNPKLQLDIFPLPAFDDLEPCLSQPQIGACYFIPKKAKHIKEAKLFINFMSLPEQVNRAQAIRTFLPRFKDCKVPKLTPLQQKIVDYINKGRVTVEMNAFMKVDLNDLWRYYQDMFAGAKTPEEVLKAWDKRFAELMKARGEPGF
jgi:raffinose/stachyose/melibiose transport system substrate-binding protein